MLPVAVKRYLVKVKVPTVAGRLVLIRTIFFLFYLFIYLFWADCIVAIHGHRKEKSNLKSELL